MPGTETTKIFIVAPADSDVERFIRRLKGSGAEVVGGSRGYLDAERTPSAIVQEIQKHTELDAVIIFGWINGARKDNSEGNAVAELIKATMPSIETIGVVDPHDVGEFNVDDLVHISDTARLLATLILVRS